MWLGVVDNLAVALLLETSFIDTHIRKSFPTERTFVPWYPKPVDIFVPATKTQSATTVVDHIDSQPFPAYIVEDMYHKVVVAKATKLAPHTHTPELVSSSGPSTLVLEQTNECPSYTSVQVERDLVTVIANKPFHVSLTSMSNKPVGIPMCMIVAHPMSSPAHIMATKAALLEADPEATSKVHCKPSVEADNWMTHHQNVKAKDDQMLKLEWRGAVQLPDD